MVAEIGIIMNSAAIIALAIVAKKHTKRIKEINEIQLRKEQRMEQETKWGKELLAGKIEAAEIDLKSLRMEITGRGKDNRFQNHILEITVYALTFQTGIL